jgi:adenylyltransferase/sulfurtransferase
LLDGTDNFETRYLLNDLAVKHGIPYCYGGVVGTRGMQFTVIPEGERSKSQRSNAANKGGTSGSDLPFAALPFAASPTPCLRCLFETPPSPGSVPTCDTAGVLGPVVSIVAACQASDAIKLLLGRGDLVSPTLLEVDLWLNQRRRVELAAARRAECPCCGSRRFEYLESWGGGSASLCGQNAVQVCPRGAFGETRIDLSALAVRLQPHGTFEVGRFFLRGDLTGSGAHRLGLTVFPDGRAIVRGTERVDVARGIYSKFVGG